MPVTASDTATSFKDPTVATPVATVQDRLTRTQTPRFSARAEASSTLTLGTRLALSVALSVATVISLVAMAGAFIAGQQIETDLRETARVTAVAVGDDIEL